MNVEAIVASDAGAETPVVSAEIQGDQTVATPEGGAEPTTQAAEPDAEGETTSQEGDSAGEGRQKHQTTLEERALQLAEKRFAEMQANFENTLKAKQEAEARPFVPVDMDKVNAYLLDMKDAIAEAEFAGDMVKALDLQEQVSELRKSIKDNEKKRTEWEKQQENTTKQQADQTARLKQIDEAAEFYRSSKNIPQATWDAAGVWINEQFQKDPVLGRKFVDLIDRQGEMAAFEWADQYVQSHMGTGAAADKAAKEAGKGALPTTTAGAGTVAGVPTTWNELIALPSEKINKFQKENPEVFQKLKDAHFK